MIYPEVVKESIDDKQVVHVKFKEFAQPYLAYNIPQIRVADEDLVMDQDTYADMLRMREDKGRNWEQRESDYQITDIDLNVFENYLQRARRVGRIAFYDEDIRTVLNKLNLIRGGRLLNAEAVLFVESNINKIQLAKYASDERLTFTDIRREAYGGGRWHFHAERVSPPQVTQKVEKLLAFCVEPKSLQEMI